MYEYDEDNYGPCRWWYRNQSHEYVTDIRDYNDGLMGVRLKDNSGDPDSPIHGKRSKRFKVG